MGNYNQSPEEKLLDEIVQIILGNDRDEGGTMSYQEARAVAEDYREYGRGIMAIKIRNIMARLGNMVVRELSSHTITYLQENTKNDDEMDDILISALMIMLVKYRPQFIKLLKRWGIDPYPYIDTYKKSQL